MIIKGVFGERDRKREIRRIWIDRETEREQAAPVMNEGVSRIHQTISAFSQVRPPRAETCLISLSDQVSKGEQENKSFSTRWDATVFSIITNMALTSCHTAQHVQSAVSGCGAIRQGYSVDFNNCF